MNPKHILKTFTPLLVVFTILLASNFISAAPWKAPTANPPNGNVAAPLNESRTNQLKEGDITARSLKAGLEVWSDRYCDGNGANCVPVTGSLPDCAVGQILQVGLDGNWACAQMPSGGGGQFILDEAQIKQLMTAEINADISPSDLNSPIGVGIYASTTETQRICAAFAESRGAANGTYIKHSTRSWYSPNDNYTVLYDGSTWSIENSSYPLVYDSCLEKGRGGDCISSGYRATGLYNRLISSITCEL